MKIHENLIIDFYTDFGCELDDYNDAIIEIVDDATERPCRDLDLLISYYIKDNFELTKNVANHLNTC